MNASTGGSLPRWEAAETAFSETERDQLPEPSRVSVLAILALVAGWASALAVWSPIVLLLALVASVLGLLALRQIEASDPPRLGRAAAVAGLCLGLLFGSWGLARQQLHRRILERQAQQFADQWWAMVQQGQLREAHELMRAQEVRAAPEAELEKVYAEDEERRTSLKATFADEPLRSVVEAGTAGRLVCESVEQRISDRMLGVRKEIVSLRYRLEGQRDPPTSLLVDMARTTGQGLPEARWSVQGVRFPKLTSKSK